MTALSSYIENFLSVSVVDAIALTQTDGLAVVARLSDVALDGGSERVRTYTTTSDLAADVTAGEIDADTSTAVTNALGAGARAVLVIKWDVGGAETAADALNAAETAGFRPPWDYCHLIMDSRTASDHVSAAGWAATRRVLLWCQSGDGDWLTASVPAGYSTITSNTQTAVLYEDTAAAEYDATWAGRFASALPDSQRPGSNQYLPNAVEYGTLLTSTQQTNLGANNCNWHQVITPSGTQRIVRSRTGTTSVQSKVLSGSTIALRYTVLVTEVRLIQDLGGLVSALALRSPSESLPAGDAGIAAVRAVVEARMATLIRAGYVQQTTALPRGYDLTYTLASGADPQLTITGQIAYLGEIGTIAISLDLT